MAEQFRESTEAPGCFLWARRKRILVGKVLVTNLKELVFLLRAKNIVVKVLVETLGNVGEIPFHFMNLAVRPVDLDLLQCGLLPELFDVGEEILPGWNGDWLPGVRCAQLLKAPWVADGSAAHHESCSSGECLYCPGGIHIDNITVGDHWTGQGFDCSPDTLGMNRGLVALFYRSSVNGESVDLMPKEYVQ